MRLLPFALTGIPGPPYVNGQFSNGPVWVQDLAAGLGLAPLQPSVHGGTDYAYGSGETGNASIDTSNPIADILGPMGQLAQFETAHATADPNALLYHLGRVERCDRHPNQFHVRAGGDGFG